MKTLLRVDSSSRTTGSHSRALGGDTVEAAWLARNPGGNVIRRDLTVEPVRHISNFAIAGFYTPAEQHSPDIRRDIALSDTLIAQIDAASALLVTVPMYNFSIPSSLKAWIDHIVRINRTFSYDGTSFTGLVTGKPVYITCAYGAGGYDGGALASYDLMRSYLDLLFGFLGFTEIHFVSVEGTTADSVAVANHVAAAQQRARALIAA
jgi:FMN-dependent NADH-azoreductase